MAFRMKRKPSKPKRLEQQHSLHFTHNETLAHLLKRLPVGVAHKDIILTYGQVRWTALEPDAIWNRKIAKYDKDLAAYEKWLVDNKSEIEAAAYKKTHAKRLKYEAEVAALNTRLKKVYDKLDTI